MMSLGNLLGGSLAKSPAFPHDEIAHLLRVSPEALATFERSYQKEVLDNTPDGSNLFDYNSRNVPSVQKPGTTFASNGLRVHSCAVQELLAQTRTYVFDNE